MSTAAPLTAETPKNPKARYPDGVPYIIGNEGAERFSFYGMKAILWVHMVALFTGTFAGGAELVSAELTKAAEAKATARMHLFIAGVYAFPMIGALIADRLLGKYRVILWLSLVYCAGNAVVAFGGTTEMALYVGLALIALGSGGIKPCVSANVGDQFTKENAHLVTKIFQAFYFIINFGSFFSTLITPWLYAAYGPTVAFGVPGVLMALATLIFWLGRHKFVKVPPKPGGKLGGMDALASILFFMPFAAFAFGGEGNYAIKTLVAVASVGIGFVIFSRRQKIAEDSGFISVLLYSLQHRHERQPGQGFFDVARQKYGDEAAEGPPAVLRIAVVFSMVSVFWALFDQHSSSWINQAKRMDLDLMLPLGLELHLKPSQLAALNPAMVMVLIPLMSFVVFPGIERLGLKLTPLRKMTTGMILAALSFVAVALLQARIDELALVGQKVPVLWQAVPYVIITIAEVLVSVTGLEFAYTQAPRAMKSTLMGFWLLCVTVGNLLVAFLAGFESLPLEQFFWVFAGLMALASAIFGVLAYFYKGKTYLQHG